MKKRKSKKNHPPNPLRSPTKANPQRGLVSRNFQKSSQTKIVASILPLFQGGCRGGYLSPLCVATSIGEGGRADGLQQGRGMKINCPYVISFETDEGF
jgi:hypothetical protein